MDNPGDLRYKIEPRDGIIFKWQYVIEECIRHNASAITFWSPIGFYKRTITRNEAIARAEEDIEKILRERQKEVERESKTVIKTFNLGKSNIFSQKDTKSDSQLG